MNEKTKQLLWVEIAALVLAMAPYAVMMIVNGNLEGELTDAAFEELFYATYGLILYIVYPIAAFSVSMLLSFLRIDFRYSMLAAPLGFLLGAFLFMGLDLITVAVAALAYTAIGALSGFVAGKLRARLDK